MVGKQLESLISNVKKRGAKKSFTCYVDEKKERKFLVFKFGSIYQLDSKEEVKSMDYAINLGKEIERVELLLKAMKAELKAFVDINGPVDTGDVIWDYSISASWSFNEEGLKELAQNMVLEGVNPWKVL